MKCTISSTVFAKNINLEILLKESCLNFFLQITVGPFSSSQKFVIRKPQWSNFLFWIQLILVRS